MMLSTDPKTLSQDQLLSFLQKQCEETLQLEKYYEKCLAELRENKNESVPLLHSLSQIDSPSQQKARPRTKRMKTEEVSSFMEESNVSIDVREGEKRERKLSKKQSPSFDMEYQLLSKELNKMIDSLCNKDNNFRKTPVATPKKTLTTRSNIKPQPQPQVSLFKISGNLSAVSSKTEREQGQEQRQQLLLDLGDTTAIVSNDEVVCKLISNLRIEEERFADALLQRSQMAAMSKMKNYLEHLAEKNEQTLFKVKQSAIDRSLSKREGNKQTIRSGYTERMRQAIESGLRRREGKQQ